MGLDMYLNKKTYVKQWDHEAKEKQFSVDVKRGDKSYDKIKSKRITHVTEEVAYWRKANHLHNWFVENVQKGVDDCGSYIVEREKLEDLVTVCKEVLEKRDDKTSSDLLPTTSGFFFGTTEYDKYYYGDIEETVENLEGILGEVSEGEYPEFYYESSW